MKIIYIIYFKTIVVVVVFSVDKNMYMYIVTNCMYPSLIDLLTERKAKETINS